MNPSRLVRAYDPVMGEENHDRQLRRARVAYVGAAGRFRQALDAFDNSGMPMDPGPDVYEPYPWTDVQWQIFRDFVRAVDELVDTRRTWDGMRREWRPAH